MYMMYAAKLLYRKLDLFLNPSGIFQKDQVNTIATNALAPCVARSLVAVVLIM